MNSIDKLMDKDFLQGKGFRRILFGVGIFFIALIIFQCGIFVGFRKASFSYRMGDNYYRAFDKNDGYNSYPMGMGMMRGGFPDSHGAVGQIIKITLPNLVIEDTQGIEKTVVIDSTTVIKKFRDSIKNEDLRVGDFVTIIGSPDNNSVIDAKLIRVLPPPQSASSTQAIPPQNN
jgi:hypothetical protein